MKRVYRSVNRMLVHHSRNLLDAEGIGTTLRNENLGGAMGEVPFLECEIELWVLDERDAERAAAILKYGALAPLEKGPPWRCKCGETLETQFLQCWNCGGEKSGPAG